jgi:hypothetical protein
MRKRCITFKKINEIKYFFFKKVNKVSAGFVKVVRRNKRRRAMLTYHKSPYSQDDLNEHLLAHSHPP